VWKPKVSVVCMTLAGTLGLPGAALAQEPGVHLDPGSPAGKEYAIPLAEGRAEGAGTTKQRAAADTPFGVGITPRGGGGTGGPKPGGRGGGPTRSGTGGDGPRGARDGVRGSGSGKPRAEGRADRRGENRRVIDENKVSDAEAPVDTTARTLGVAFGVLLVGTLLALLLWWRREQPAA
jgi:hypothetical protein